MSHGPGAELSIFLGNLDHLGRGPGVSHSANWGNWRSYNRLQHSPAGLHLISEPRAPFPRPHHTLCRHPGTSSGGIFCSLQSSVFMFNSVESCFNNDFIWFTLSTADRQIGDSPKLLKIQEKYRRQ